MDLSVEHPVRSLHNALFRRQAGKTGSSTNDEANSSSISSMVSTLVPVLALAVPFFFLFLFLRRSQRRQYAPRTYLGALRKEEQSPELPGGMFNWFGTFFSIPDSFVLNHQSLDGYLFLRFLKIVVTICFVGCLITWPVLFPINITGGGSAQQLDLLSMSNIAESQNNRYFAHVFVSWIFFGFIVFMVTRETIFYINLRQAYLLSPLYANRISSRTVLFTSVPEQYLHEARLRQMFGPTLKNLWIASDCKEVEKLVKERDKVSFKLEGAEVKLIKLVNAARLKSQKGRGQDAEAATDGQTQDSAGDGESGSIASKWLPQKKRPTHRLKPLIGKKVDTINWSRSELETLIPKVEALQAKHRAGEAKFVGSVFVEFISQSAAQDALQALPHHLPLHMAPRFIGVNPEEIIWKNLKIKWWERLIRFVVVIAFLTVLILFWGVPVAFCGSISNIQALFELLPWLRFLEAIPDEILGVVTGLLPAVLLAVLMALLPIILRLAAKLKGDPSLSAVELSVQNSYFAFQVIQAFLVTTLSSAASAVVNDIIKDPTTAPAVLANSLPKASNFYISYFIVQGLAISSGALLQIVGLILFKFLGKILDNTPRKMYKRWATLTGLGWGTVFPVFTNLAVIAITYSCIAPLVLGFATVGLYLIYFMYRYNFLFVYNANIDTKGLVYPKALQQILVGVYLAEVCLIGLFGVGKAPGPAILEVVALIATILYHMALSSATAPLLKYLPKSMATEEESLLAMETGRHNGEEDRVGGSRNGKTSDKAQRVLSGSPGSPTGPRKKPNMFVKWLRPDKYADYHTLRRLVPRAFADISYHPEVERNAYYHPAIASTPELLWIPRDPAGVSRQEVRHTSKVIPISDEGSHLDEKNKLVADVEGRPPVWKEKIYY
ncbi:MAG: Transmembrane protein 63C [Piccolia ochrophora]|nr:MAG: Transmembrane protein 63C [Piccolia ochrophora]